MVHIDSGNVYYDHFFKLGILVPYPALNNNICEYKPQPINVFKDIHLFFSFVFWTFILDTFNF